MNKFIAKKETIEIAMYAALTRVMKVKVKTEEYETPKFFMQVSPDFGVLTILKRVLETGEPDYETIKKYRK